MGLPDPKEASKLLMQRRAQLDVQRRQEAQNQALDAECARDAQRIVTKLVNAALKKAADAEEFLAIDPPQSSEVVKLLRDRGFKVTTVEAEIRRIRKENKNNKPLTAWELDDGSTLDLSNLNLSSADFLQEYVKEEFGFGFYDLERTQTVLLCNSPPKSNAIRRGNVNAWVLNWLATMSGQTFLEEVELSIKAATRSGDPSATLREAEIGHSYESPPTFEEIASVMREVGFKAKVIENGVEIHWADRPPAS